MKDKTFSAGLLEKINVVAPELLQNYDDVKVILELCGYENSPVSFNELMFNAKYIKGLRTVLSKFPINEDEYMQKMFKEFTSNLEKFSLQLKSLLADSGDAVTLFNKKYFELEHDCMANLMSLINDLSLCKEYFNRTGEE
ncbi:MAG: hypothetical protein HGGPFJEG_00355 [Ignavibacteria bacterium]|nr:hypothetical protein [Ignavibacteria bacterium]